MLGVIDAADDAIARGLAQLRGRSFRPLDASATTANSWRNLEAGLDFADEDIEFISARRAGCWLRRRRCVTCASGPRGIADAAADRAGGPAERRQEQPVECPVGPRTAAIVSPPTGHDQRLPHRGDGPRWLPRTAGRYGQFWMFPPASVTSIMPASISQRLPRLHAISNNPQPPTDRALPGWKP